MNRSMLVIDPNTEAAPDATPQPIGLGDFPEGGSIIVVNNTRFDHEFTTEKGTFLKGNVAPAHRTVEFYFSSTEADRKILRMIYPNE